MVRSAFRPPISSEPRFRIADHPDGIAPSTSQFEESSANRAPAASRQIHLREKGLKAPVGAAGSNNGTFLMETSCKSRLITAVEKGRIPLSAAMQIANAD